MSAFHCQRLPFRNVEHQVFTEGHLEKLTALLLLGPNLLNQVDGGIASTYSHAHCPQGLCSVSNLPWAHLITCLLVALQQA